jgi:hypothetical protein
MAVTTCEIRTSMTTNETPDSTTTATGQSVQHTTLNQSLSLSPTSTVPVTKTAGRTDFPLSGGSATINFTTMLGTGGATVTFLGLKVQSLILKNKSTNTGNMTFVPGASNGIDLFGASSSITLKPGHWVHFYFHDSSPDVASGDCTIDVTGTGSEQFEIHAVAG